MARLAHRRPYSPCESGWVLAVPGAGKCAGVGLSHYPLAANLDLSRARSQTTATDWG